MKHFGVTRDGLERTYRTAWWTGFVWGLGWAWIVVMAAVIWGRTP